MQILSAQKDDQTILAQLHGNLWDTIRFLVKIDTGIVLLASIFDFIMIAFIAAMKASPGFLVAIGMVALIGTVACLLLLSNRRVHRNQVEALKSMYTDLDLLKYFPDRETFMYSRRYDLYMTLVILMTMGCLALGTFVR